MSSINESITSESASRDGLQDLSSLGPRTTDAVWRVSLRLPAIAPFDAVARRVREFLVDHSIRFSETTVLHLVSFVMEVPLSEARLLTTALDYIASVELLHAGDAYLLTLLPKENA